MTKIIHLDYPITPSVRAPSSHVLKLFFDEQVINQTKPTVAVMSQLEGFINTIPDKRDIKDPIIPNWRNGWFSGYDALSLCAMLLDKKPDVYFEIGSGNSTKFANAVINYFNLQTKIISIDPEPRREIDLICNKVYRTPCEQIDLTAFDVLTSDSVMFIDGSHRCFQNSDVTAFFLDILPGLPDGIIWGIHDIMLPDDYPKDWETRYYNEQYMLAAYMLGGAGRDKLIYNYKTITHTESESKAEFLRVFDNHPQGELIKNKRGSACWFKRN